MGKIADFKKGAEDIVSEWAVPVFAFLLFLLLVALVSVMFSDCAAKWVGELLGTKGNNNKTTTIQLLGWIMSGVLAVIGLVFLNRRAEAQMRAAEAQTDVAKSQVENNRLVEKGHAQERYKTATEHLGNKSTSIRIAAFYEFVQLANGNKERYLKSILKILYAHIRITTTDSAYNKEVLEGNKPQPTEEIQGLLDGLFRFKEIERGDMKPNLQRVDFSGADLANGDLSGADLRKAKLLGANLSEADLSGANLRKADLSSADLCKANLSRANLSKANLFKVILLDADLSKVDLSEAKLPKAVLCKANLSGADLFKVNLVEADLSSASLVGADLFQAKLSGAVLPEADLSEADLIKVDLSGTFLYKAKLFRADLSEADLSGANLSKANLSQARLGGAFYTNKTIFPEWFVPPIDPPDDGDEVQFPKGFVAPDKPDDDE